MTNAEKFKEDFGFELKNIGRYEDGYYCIDSDADIECKTCPLYEKGCSHVAFINWWNSEYKGEPTIPLGEPELSSGFELGYEHGKADNNDKWLEWIEELESEIEGESQVEEIFDEDSFNSMNSEANLPEVAECESYIETDIIPLHKLFAIIERKLKEIGSEA